MPDASAGPLPSGCPVAGVVIGFDYGTKHIGVAVGETVTCSARPLCRIQSGRQHEPWKTIGELSRTWAPVAFVVGLPASHEGRENRIASQIRVFAKGLRSRHRLPVFEIDETLSTAESRQRYRATPAGRRKPFLELKDELAAQVILQSWLESGAEFREFNLPR